MTNYDEQVVKQIMEQIMHLLMRLNFSSKEMGRNNL